MLCPSCGTSVGTDVKLCEECQKLKDIEDAEDALREPELPLEASSDSRGTAGRGSSLRNAMSQTAMGVSGVESRQNPSRSSLSEVVEPVEFEGYAGFWLRALAFALDSALLVLLLKFICLLLPIGEINESVTAFGTEMGYTLGRALGSTLIIIGLLTASTFTVLYFIFSQFVLGLVYYAFFESSERGGSPGKILLGIRVCDIDGNTLTFFEASSRHLAKLLSYATGSLGFFLAAFTSHKQALHDLVSGTVVIKTESVSIVRVFSVILLTATFLSLSSSGERKEERIEKRPAYTGGTATRTGPSNGFRSKTAGVVQVGAVNEILRGAVVLYNPKDYHGYFFFYRSEMTLKQVAALKSDPRIETAESFKPDLLIRLRFRQGVSACDRLQVEQMQVALLPGYASLPLLTRFNFAGVVADKLSLNCRLNDGAIYLAEFNAIAKSRRQQIRWDIESSGYLYYTESTAAIPLDSTLKRAIRR